MKITLADHSRSTKMSDLLMLIFAVAYFVAGLCFAQEFVACFIFLICVICIILIKYFKLTKNEQ